MKDNAIASAPLTAPLPHAWFYRLLAQLSPLLPHFLVPLIAAALGPRRVARLVGVLGPERFRVLAKALPTFLHVRHAPYFDEAARIKTVAALPLDTTLATAKALCAAGDFATAAAFAEHLPGAALKQLIVQINDAEQVAQIARRLQPATVLQVLQMFSGSYLLKLAVALIRFEYFDLSASLGDALPLDRLAALVQGIAPDAARHLLPRLDADRLDRLYAKLPATLAERLRSAQSGAPILVA